MTIFPHVTCIWFTDSSGLFVVGWVSRRGSECQYLSEPSAFLQALIMHESINGLHVSGGTTRQYMRPLTMSLYVSQQQCMERSTNLKLNCRAQKREMYCLGGFDLRLCLPHPPGNLSKTCTADGWTVMHPFDIAVNCGYNLNSTSDDVSKPQSLRGSGTDT